MRFKIAIVALVASSLFSICDAAACGRHHRERFRLFSRTHSTRSTSQRETRQPEVACECKDGKCEIKRSERSLLKARSSDL